MFKDQNYRILLFEQLLFSALYGVAFRSWVVFAVMFLCSSWLLNRPRGTVHMIYAMSFLWGFIAFSIGYSISLVWATALGGSFFLIGIKAHLTGIKKPVAKKFFSLNQGTFEWQRNGYEGRHNLN